MTPKRIEELARLAYEAGARECEGDDIVPWDMQPDWVHNEYRRSANALYAAAMRDAAGVARDYPRGAIAAGFNIAAALETIADSIDLDWTPRDAARAIVRAMKGGDP